MLKVEPTVLEDVLVLTHELKEDPRGPVHQTFSQAEWKAAGIDTAFVEEYLYCPWKAGTLYGIHFQLLPKAQSKLIYCLKGRCLDYAVDLRRYSATYMQWVCVELTPENRRQVYVPKGFGHALLTMENDTHIVFRIDECFDPKLSRAITYRDETLNIPFPVTEPILSEQDKHAPRLFDSGCNFE